MKYTIVLCLSYLRPWLELSREQRHHFNESVLYPIFGKYQGRVSVRFFDAEAFVGGFSDFAILEAGDLKDYYFLMEELRDTDLFIKEFIAIKNVIVGIENGYRVFEREARGDRPQQQGDRT
jgi:hypothetical protein